MGAFYNSRQTPAANYKRHTHNHIVDKTLCAEQVTTNAANNLLLFIPHDQHDFKIQVSKQTYSFCQKLKVFALCTLTQNLCSSHQH